MENILKIKNQLPHGAQTEIANSAKVSVVAVNRVLNGKTTDVKIMNAIADYLTKLKDDKASAEKRLASLID